jgi:hypothetical protein
VGLLTIFVEGSVHERAELAGPFVRPRGDDAVTEHPLVKHYGCPTQAMGLTRAHALVEGGHRRDAWDMTLAHVRDGDADAEALVATCSRALELWKDYRDGVAQLMSLAFFVR